MIPGTVYCGVVFGIKTSTGCAYVEYAHGVCCAQRAHLGAERFAQLQPGTRIEFHTHDQHTVDSLRVVPSAPQRTSARAHARAPQHQRALLLPDTMLYI